MPSLDEIADRLDIQDLLVTYAHAIDFRRWDDLDAVFTPDAFIDYSAMGGAKGSYPEVKTFLRETLPIFSSYQHLLGASRITLDGDTATGVTPCHNPMVIGEGDSEHAFLCGLWYRDRFVRTPAGWRISERVEERAYVKDAPRFG